MRYRKFLSKIQLIFFTVNWAERNKIILIEKLISSNLAVEIDPLEIERFGK